MVEEERRLLGGRLPKELRDAAEGLEAVVNVYTTAMISSTIPTGCVTTKLSGDTKRHLERGREMVQQLPDGERKFNSYLELSSAYASYGEKCSNNSLRMLQLAIGELEGAERKAMRELFPEGIADKCAGNYLLTRDERFPAALLQGARTLSIGETGLGEACCLYLRKLRSLARDKRWGITLYIND